MQAQGQFITLRDRGEAKAVVAPEQGGWLLRYLAHLPEFGYVDVLFHDSGAAERHPQSMRAGSPLLFPLVSFNHLPGEEHHYRWRGESYAMPQHGFARRLPWRVAGASESEVTLELGSSEATLREYPFDFQHRVTYRLERGRLFIRQRVENTGRRVMPFSSGLHPYFPVPIQPGGRRESCFVELPGCRRVTQFNNWESWTAAPFAPRRLPVDADYSGTLFLTDLERREVSLVDAEAGLRIRLNYEEAPQHRFLALWSPASDAPSFCMEPWTALPNAFTRAETELLLLDPGAVMEWQVWLGLERVTRSG